MFLDEIGELSPALQAKLLRVLQEREFERVGGTRSIAVDVRLVAATNRDLEQAIARRHASARTSITASTSCRWRVPPLRERPEDIPLLADHFARRHAAKHEAAGDRLSPPEALTCLHGVRLARQRPRAGERDRAGGGAGLRPT